MENMDMDLFKTEVIKGVIKMDWTDYNERFIDNFKTVLTQNIIKRAKYKVGFTFVSIKTNMVTGKFKWHNYVIIIPFKQENISGYPDINNDKIRLKDVCIYVDESFYKFIHSVMLNKKNFIIGKISEENDCCWQITNDYNIIKIINKHSLQQMLIQTDFDEWYEAGRLHDSDYVVEIKNPDMYLVPFPVKPIYFVIHLPDDGFNYLKRVSNSLIDGDNF